MSFSAPYPQPSSTGTIGNDGSGPFDPGNTPPLVFAFVALGFTLFGLVIAVIYKRCRPSQSSQEPPYPRSVPVTQCSGQKPKLWDVWIPTTQNALGEEQTKNITDWDTFLVSCAFSPSPVRRCRRSLS